MIETTLFITSLLSFGIIPVADAASGLLLLKDDVTAWEQESKTTLSQTHAEDADDSFQSSADLFPQISGGEEETIAQTARDERTEGFVSVTMGTTLVTMKDVPRTEWFAPYVRTIAEQGIVTGYKDGSGKPLGLFGPADNVTIEQLAKVILLSSKTDTSSCEGIPLNKTASGSWSSSFVSCAEKKEWAVFADGTVDVQRNAMRSEVIVTLLQAFKVNTLARTGDAFSDVTLSTQFGSAIEQAKKDGIVTGYSDESGIPLGTFGPEDPVTRAEFAKIVTLGMQVYGGE